MDEVQNPDLLLVLLAIIFAPLVLLSIVAMFKHYHLWIHIYRGDKQHEDKEDHG